MSINKLTVLFTFFLIFSKIFCEDSFDFFTFALQWPQEICRQVLSKNETGICNIPGNINIFYLMQNFGMVFLTNFKVSRKFYRLWSFQSLDFSKTIDNKKPSEPIDKAHGIF